MIESTFVIIKPDAIEQQIVGDIIARLEGIGLSINWIGGRRKDEDWVKQHYAGNPHLTKEMIAFMADFLIGIVLRGEDAIKRTREVVGPVVGPPMYTIRGWHGGHGFRNLIHAADSQGAVQKEFTLFRSTKDEHT